MLKCAVDYNELSYIGLKFVGAACFLCFVVCGRSKKQEENADNVFIPAAVTHHTVYVHESEAT